MQDFSDPFIFRKNDVSLCLNEDQVLQALHYTLKTLENQRLSHVFKDHSNARKTPHSFQIQINTERKKPGMFPRVFREYRNALKTWYLQKQSSREVL